MGVIIGKGFDPIVIDQINIRQEKLGLTDLKSDDLLKYTNNKTSWLRLSSGVDVDAAKTKELGLSGQEGNILAKNNVLFSARKYINTNQQIDRWEAEFTAGVGYGSFSSYGFDSDPNYGLVPPPGITSADIKSLNRGSLREANINITCHNIQQFKIIETLYLRLGYSILLEWGHTFWYDNKGGLRSDMPDWIHQGFLKGDYDQDLILDILFKNRKEFQGNYDGFFGVIVNFDWDLKPDGSYEISIKAKSVGDIIESLKLNTSFPFPNWNNSFSANLTDPQKKLLPNIISNSQKSTLNWILFNVRGLIENIAIETLGENDNSSLGLGRVSLNTDLIAGATGLRYNFKRDESTDGPFLGAVSGYKAYFEKLQQIESEDTTLVFQGTYYISLGTLLRIIENFLTLNTFKNNNKPLFYIDYNFNDNLCFTIPNQTSTDPTVCLIPTATEENISQVSSNPSYVNKYIEIITTERKVASSLFGGPTSALSAPFINEITQSRQIVDNLPANYILGEPKVSSTTISNPVLGASNIEVNTTVVYYSSNSTPDQLPSAEDRAWWEDILSTNTITNTALNIITEESNTNAKNLDNIDYIFRTSNPFIGKTMDIQVNLDYIANVLTNNVDEEGKTSLYNFLKQLMTGIQNALGNINSFEVIYTAETNTFSIIDNTSIPGIFDFLEIDKPIVAKFNPSLLKPNYGSFVNSVSIKSQLDNKFTAMITIGAQVNNNKVGENTTAFSSWNKGLTDRIITTKQNINDPNSSTPEEPSKSPEEVYRDNLLKLFEFRSKINNGTVTSDDISNNKQSIVDLLKYEVGYYTEQDNIPGVGFIPLNLQLEVDGLSGVKIYEVYNIDDTLLPQNYRDNIQFITRGVSHKIDSNGWRTTLESFSGPKEKTLKQLQTVKKQKSTNRSLTDVKKAEQLFTNGNCDSLPSNRFNIAERILQEANKYGIKDKNRLTCLLTVAYAESRFDLRISENFKYRVDKIGTGTSKNWNGDASVIFKDSLRKVGVDTNSLKNILTNPSDSLANYVYANKGSNKGPSSGDGFKYRGRGISQTTYKSGYQSTQNALKKYNINIDLISNPDNIFQYEIPVLIIGKLEGLYGDKLSTGVDYINNATNIAQTQNGGKKDASSNYIDALRCINSNSKIQELISKYS